MTMRRTLTHRLAGLGQEPNREEMEYLLYPTADEAAARRASTADDADDAAARRASTADDGDGSGASRSASTDAATKPKKPFDWLFWLMLAGTVKRLAF